MCRPAAILLASTGCILAGSINAAELRGSVAVDHRYFPQSPLVPLQYEQDSSLVVEPEFYVESEDRRDSLTFVPFYRKNSHDDERTHADLRELYWLHIGDRYEVSLGYRKVFWGTTEFLHLVDVINQTDLVENPDGEDKLGQAMLNTRLITDYGVFDTFLLPRFRERTFPADNGRLNPVPSGVLAPAIYEHGDRDRHLDWAARWSATVNNWDIGVAHFQGTNREPLLVPASDSAGNPVLAPYYEQMRQTSIDVQGATGSWLWKLEAIQRDTETLNFTAFTAGLEFTFFQVLQSSLDVGLVAEYLYDDRKATYESLFEDDVMLGIRLNPNDVRGTEFLLGVVRDRHDQSSMYRLETGRRLSEHWRLNFEVTVFSGLPDSSPFFSFRNEDYFQAEIRYYF